MLLRALVLLVIVIGLSVLATLHFGQDVLIALGLILTQIKVIAKKLAGIELPAVLAWVKAQAEVFLRIELFKKWLSTTLIPLLLGNAVIRRIERFLGRYKMAVRHRYMALLRWYRALEWYEKVVAALIILFAALALSVSSIGVWLILFSVKLPLWVIAVTAAFGRMVWASVEKMAFRSLAFFQLTWAWKALQWVLPEAVLERKRRLDYRVARMVVRKRRMTLKQLAEKKDSLPLRLALIAEYLRQPVGPAAKRGEESRSGGDRDPT